ncbi:alpha-L-rhamnosidase-related protein [Actinomadura opuntiae]|uniref:alpha-L-rhamnosidase-related protein n=1 Tax=Actinomadura sp. OS1-43 TaxID=604315 RepID=UPI00255AA7F3|nr:alpha-L-rhamnosidase C-terminal domain-containing protein [Actinomadura sp. OS1-43]MDL4817285.1 alpha-L-rhamnosidase C-terminal domain-containing protein [Actinomadura sp. OS1-43]
MAATVMSVGVQPAIARADSPDWHSYVLGPSAAQVKPVHVDARGKVSHPNTLVTGKGQATKLTTVAGQAPASVLLDFGKDVGGTPYIDVAAVSGAPSLSLVTGEARGFLRKPAATTVAAEASAGATQVKLASTNGLETGDKITFGTGAGAQARTITAFDAATGTVSFTPALTDALPVGTAVSTALGAPASDESPGLAGVGGLDTLTPGGKGRVTAKFHGGFRFVLLTLTTPGTVSISGAGVDFQAFRATPRDYAGWFLSSDRQLNKMWYSGAYTVQLNMKAPGLNGLPDARIYDGAKRDRSIWTGDLIVQEPTVLSTLGDAGAPYVKSSLDVLLASQRADGAFPGSPDFAKGRNPAGSPLFYSNNYSEYGSRAFIDYYRYTGDEAYIRAALPALRRELAYNATFVNGNDLVVSNDRDYWQATQTGEVTKYSVDYYALLREMAWVERKVGSADAAADDDSRAEAVKTAINTRLWNPDLGAYGQSSDNPGRLVEDANAAALQYGIVPEDRRASVLAALKKLWTPYGTILGPGLADPTGHTIEPYGNGMETAGRFAAGDTAGAFDLMRRTWGQMVDERDPLYTGGLWEFKNNSGGVNRTTASLAHGWAASPTVQLTEQVLGIAPADPGYASWSIKPRPGTLKWSKGAVPTKNGTITAGWTSNPGTSYFDLNARTPSGTHGTISVPADEKSVVTVNGKTAWNRGKSEAYDARAADGYVALNVPGGGYHVTVTRG